MRIRFLGPARDDLREAARYYNAQRRGLGTEFREEVRSTVARISSLPEAWHPVGADTRRWRVRRFPYGVIYHVADDEILIVAVAHLHREPDYRRERLQ